MAAEGFEGHVEEFELSLGHVTGVRGFLRDSLGRLTGVTHREVFRPGVNVARCGLCELKNLADCSCGYYAYFLQDAYGQSDTSFYGGEVGAIIRGYGRTVVGTKGFRAEKADLLAFFPIETANRLNVYVGALESTSKFRGLYPTLGWYRKSSDGAGLFLSLIASIVSFVGLALTFVVAVAAQSMPAIILMALVCGAALPWLAGWIRRVAHADLVVDWDDDYSAFRGAPVRQMRRLCRVDSSSAAPTYMDKFEDLQLLYPDVPVYPSLREATEAHPLTPPHEHQPPEDFWDRAANNSSSRRKS